ncbi:MAG: hypothetical protein ACR2RF_20685 [Geminicoccaceae bacterium]
MNDKDITNNDLMVAVIALTKAVEANHVEIKAELEAIRSAVGSDLVGQSREEQLEVMSADVREKMRRLNSEIEKPSRRRA